MMGCGHLATILALTAFENLSADERRRRGGGGSVGARAIVEAVEGMVLDIDETSRAAAWRGSDRLSDSFRVAYGVVNANVSAGAVAVLSGGTPVPPSGRSPKAARAEEVVKNWIGNLRGGEIEDPAGLTKRGILPVIVALAVLEGLPHEERSDDPEAGLNFRRDRRELDADEIGRKVNELFEHPDFDAHGETIEFMKERVNNHSVRVLNVWAGLWGGDDYIPEWLDSDPPFEDIVWQ